MKTLRFLPLVIVLLCNLLFAGIPDKYSQIRVFVPDKETLARIWSSGIDYEGSSGKIGGWMEFVAGKSEMEHLTAKGVSYEVVIDDLVKDYEERQARQVQQVEGFHYGSMGGFYTFIEVVQQLDSMRLLYPSRITAKASIGTTVEGRTMWIVKISDNPDVNEPNEPEVLYTALHHAREPEGMMSIMYYMWWLLENYGVDPVATYLVNNRQMWFLPVMNADGYVYNQTTNPGGGGMWRKNRRNNGGGIYGVDPNRNYGPYYMWNSANGGSSTNPSDETYRGTAQFSEPENRAMDTLMRNHNFKTALNYHTYGNYLIYPYGYLSAENSDSLIYRDWTYFMTFDNHFTNGTDLQTVAYSTRGNSDDYMFGDTTKPRTFTMTPEVGTTGFWPTQSEIYPLAQACLRQNKLLSYFAGPYPNLQSYQITGAGGNGFLDPGESFTFQPSIKNKGLTKASSLTVTVSTNNAGVLFSPSFVTLDSLLAQATTQLSFNGTVAGGATPGVPFQLYVEFSDPDGFSKKDTVSFYIGTPITVFADSASSGTSNWTTGTGWGLTSTSHTAPNAFTDSPSGNYAANANNSLTTVSQISLTGYQYAQLRFWTKWATEPTWDFATVEVSTNNGSTWTTLRTGLSHSGSGRDTQQPINAWGFESYTPGMTWVEQYADLTAYVGSQIKLRFKLAADGGEERDGFYVDDIRVLGYSVPLIAPSLASPTDGATGQPRRPTLFWHPSVLATSYRLQIAVDSTFTTVALDDSSLTDTSKFLSPLAYNTTYYWRARAKNGSSSSPFSTAWKFTTIIASPSIPTLVSPSSGAISQPLSLTLEWNPSPTAVSYRLQFSTDSTFTTILVDDSTLADTSRQIDSLPHKTKYFWHVNARNAGGPSAYSQTWNFTTVVAAPAVPILASPINEATSQSINAVLRWNPVTDAATYRVQVSLDSAFTSPTVDDSTVSDTTKQLSSLANNTHYFWRARSSNVSGTSDWSSTWRFTTGLSIVSYSMNNRWNIVSLPLTVDDPATSVVFPTASSLLYSFSVSGGYDQKDSLINGEGYWLKFPSAQSVDITGYPRDLDTVDVEDGWNLFGSISSSVPVTSIQQMPSGIIQSQVFEYNGGYTEASTIEPAKGYWVRVNQQGKLVLASGGLSKEVKQPVSSMIDGFHALTVTDEGGGKTQLYFGADIPEDFQNSRFELPPLPPAGAFDARFENQSKIGIFGQNSNAIGNLRIKLQSSAYPMMISLTRRGNDQTQYEIVEENASRMESVHELTSDVQIMNSAVRSIILRRHTTQEQMPKEFALTQNYPNPFNPSTVIRFDLPVPSVVTLKIFNILGQELRGLVNERSYQAGTYSIPFEADFLNSGVYYYRLMATPTNGDRPVTIGRKMTIIK